MEINNNLIYHTDFDPTDFDHTDFEQQSEKWHQVRAGKLTATSFQHVGKTGKVTQKEQELLYRLAGEIEIGDYDDPMPPTIAMRRGLKLEATARKLYEIQQDTKVEKVGFVERNKYLGYSPDGLINNRKAGIEIKCLNIAQHKEVLETQKIIKKYEDQVYFQLWTGLLDYVDFVCFHPKFVFVEKELLIVRVYPEDAIMKKTGDRICRFINELDKLINK